MRIVSIDYSLNSPALFALDTETKNRAFYFYAQKKCQIGDFTAEDGTRFVGYEPKKLDGMDRYVRNAAFVLDHCFCWQPDIVGIEDYSYMSVSSSMLSLAENGGILRYRLHECGLKYECVSPTHVKKIATGKGNADKDAMWAAWLEKEKIDVAKLLQCKPHSNPVSDIVDSFFVAKAVLAKYSII